MIALNAVPALMTVTSKAMDVTVNGEEVDVSNNPPGPQA
jgi:hypothetical protein